jgi:hypothetical protein
MPVMPKLPAISFLGLRGPSAWAAVAAAGVGGFLVVQRALPALMGGSSAPSAAAGSPAAPTAELLAGLTRAIAETSSRTAVAGLGPGASLGMSGLGVARDATNTMGRLAETGTRALATTQTDLIRLQETQAAGILRFAEQTVKAVIVSTPPPARAALPAPAPAPTPVTITPAPIVPSTVAPARAPAPVVYPAPPPAIARYYPTSSALATAVRAAAAPGTPTGTRIKLVTGEWITV